MSKRQGVKGERKQLQLLKIFLKPWRPNEFRDKRKCFQMAEAGEKKSLPPSTNTK